MKRWRFAWCWCVGAVLAASAVPVRAQGVGGIAGWAIVGRSTVAAMPAASSVTRGLWFVTDASTSSTCATGGGSNVVVCADQGSTWAAMGLAGAATDVSCTDCVALVSETSGNHVASVATTAPLSGGAAGSEGAALTLSLSQHAGTDVTADLEEEAHASEHSLGGADAITATSLASACTDAQALGGTAAGTGVECQADDDSPDSDAEVPDAITVTGYALLAGATFTGATGVDNAQPFRLFEADANGSNYVELVAPAALTSNVTCTLENDGNPIPDSCVGDGTDASGGGASSGATIQKGDGAGGFTATKLAVGADGASVTTTMLPSDVGTPLIWLDADFDDATYNDGDAVGTATNRGSGGNFTQATASVKPTFKTGILNGKAVYRFDGGDCLTNASIGLSTFSVFVVFQASNAALLYEHSANAGGNDGSYVYTANTSASTVRRGGTTSARDFGHGASTRFDWGYSSIWHVVLHAFGGTHASHRIVPDNSWFTLQLQTTSAIDSTSTVTTEINVGCRDESSLFVNGDIAEFIAFTPRLTSAQERAVILYLQTKYSL